MPFTILSHATFLNLNVLNVHNILSNYNIFIINTVIFFDNQFNFLYAN